MRVLTSVKGCLLEERAAKDRYVLHLRRGRERQRAGALVVLHYTTMQQGVGSKVYRSACVFDTVYGLPCSLLKYIAHQAVIRNDGTQLYGQLTLPGMQMRGQESRRCSRRVHSPSQSIIIRFFPRTLGLDTEVDREDNDWSDLRRRSKRFFTVTFSGAPL